MKKLFTIVALLAAATASAQDWFPVGVTASGDVVDVSPSTLFHEGDLIGGVVVRVGGVGQRPSYSKVAVATADCYNPNPEAFVTGIQQFNPKPISFSWSENSALKITADYICQSIDPDYKTKL